MLSQKHVSRSYAPSELVRGAEGGLTGGVRLAFGRMRALAEEARPRAACVGTATALFALCDMARANAFPSAATTRFLRRELEPAWPLLATQRARYVAGLAYDLDEPGRSEVSMLSDNAQHVLRVARLLAWSTDEGRCMMLEHLLFGLLVCAPTSTSPLAAHTLLQRIDRPPLELLERWHEFWARSALPS